MSSGLRITSASLRRARAAAAVLGVLILSLLAVPALANPVPGALAPRVFTLDQVGALAPRIGAQADSDMVYMPSIHIPRSRTGAVHLHGGVYAPINASATSAMLGARFAANMGDPILLGLQTGWTYHSKSVLDSAVSGTGFEPKTVLATASANLVPAMVFLQVTLTEKYPLVPYVGVAAGYEWLILRAKDYRTDSDSTVTYGNWAWEWYAGIGMKISKSLRVDGEAFYNGGTLSRDVYDANDVRLRETVDIDGAGARIGLHIAY